jgi:predicted nucleic acid-binding protein
VKLVLDASAAIFLASAPASVCLKDATLVSVPDLFVSEVTNVVWKLHALGGMPQTECRTILGRALRLPDVVVPATTLYDEVLGLAWASKHSVYDVFYLLLARREGAALFTKDKALRRLAHRYDVETV